MVPGMGCRQHTAVAAFVRRYAHAKPCSVYFRLYALGIISIARGVLRMADSEEQTDAEALRSRLAAIVESSDDAIISKTLDGIIATWNDGATRLFGYTAEEAIGRPITILIPDELLDEEPRILERIRRGDRVDHFQTVRKRKDGTRLDISLCVSPVRNSAGAIVAASKVARDITAQKLAEDKLRLANERFRVMADSAPVLIWVADRSKARTWLNASWLRFTGRRMEQELGFGWAQNVHVEDLPRVMQIYSESFAAQEPFRTEYRMYRHDGASRWVLDHGVPLYEGRDRAFSGFIGSCIDVTESRRLQLDREESLRAERAAREEAERLGRLKDEFLATLSHELRTPLNAILGWATLLRTMPSGTPDHARGVDTIERNARVQAQIIADLLDMSRIISGKVQLDVQPVDLHELIATAVETIRPSAEAKQLRLTTTLDASAGRVRGDPNRLQQVMWNLLTNAVKFTPAGGRIDVLLERVNSHIEIIVEDSGVGIKPEFLAFVFDRFRQADASTTRRQGGLGIGLSIVKHLMELHGGSVRVKSPGEGMGSTFIVALPISVIRTEVDDRRARTFGDVDVSTVALPSLVGFTALVVDDEADARLLIARLIEERGGQVVTASSAEEALGALSAQPIDILISDIGMPVMDGYELVRKVRALDDPRARSVMAIALTAYARAEDRQRALLAGYQMHLAKPAEPRELIAGVASLLNVRAVAEDR
jgi:PAS domain S-box-containing protein